MISSSKQNYKIRRKKAQSTNMILKKNQMKNFAANSAGKHITTRKIWTRIGITIARNDPINAPSANNSSSTNTWKTT